MFSSNFFVAGKLAPRVIHRRLLSLGADSSSSSQGATSTVPGLVVGVVVGVVGLLVVVLVLAMCAGGGDKYDTVQAKATGHR